MHWDSLGTQRKGNVRCKKPESLTSNGSEDVTLYANVYKKDCEVQSRAVCKRDQ
jgi:hypothetical protein